MTEDLRVQKQKMRISMKEIRHQLTASYKREADQKIAGHVADLIEFKLAKTVFCFVSIADEIDTHPILDMVLRSGKHLAVPRCQGGGRMGAYEIQSYDQLQPGFYGIPEPDRDCQSVSREAIDFAIVPCLSCDLEGRRLGYGGGYYDRFMEKRTYPAAVICRERMLYEQIPAENYDTVMDLVITEKQIIRTNRN